MLSKSVLVITSSGAALPTPMGLARKKDRPGTAAGASTELPSVREVAMWRARDLGTEEDGREEGRERPGEEGREGRGEDGTRKAAALMLHWRGRRRQRDKESKCRRWMYARPLPLALDLMGGEKGVDGGEGERRGGSRARKGGKGVSSPG
jgi:hypothetical protein